MGKANTNISLTKNKNADRKQLADFRWVFARGVELYSNGLIAVFSFLALGYCFLGIAIVSDLFMG